MKKSATNHRLLYASASAAVLHSVVFLSLPASTPDSHFIQGKNSTEISLVSPTPSHFPPSITPPAQMPKQATPQTQAKQTTKNHSTPHPIPSSKHTAIAPNSPTPAPATISTPKPPPRPARTPAPATTPTLPPSVISSGVQSQDSKLFPIHNPAPTYPLLARRKNWEGVVTLNIEVLPSGKVGRVEILAHAKHQCFDKAALKKVKQWRFTKKEGVFTRAQWIKKTIVFNLEDL